MRLPPDALRRILEVGVRAISAYNTQPWRFRVQGEALDIHVLRTKNFFLKLEGISQMTLGFLLENLAEGGQSEGCELTVELLGDHLNLDHPIARVRFLPSSAPPGGGHAHVLQRTTNRLPYEDRPLSVDDSAALRAFLERNADPRFKVELLEGDRKEVLSDILSDLEAVRLFNPKMFREAVEFIRFTAKDNQKHRDRLDVATLMLDGRSRKALEFLRAHPWLQPLLAWALRSGERRRRLAHFTRTSGLLVFTTRSSELADYVELGRKIQRSLNFLSKQGLQSHPILSGHYLLSLIVENLEIFSSAEKEIVFTCKRDLEQSLGTLDRNVAFIARVGYCAQPVPASLRRPLESFLLPAAG